MKWSWLEGFPLLIAFVSLAITMIACGRPFRVPEQVRVPEPARPISGKLAAQTAVNGLMVEAAAITDEDELMRLFNANMILARILVVNLALKNQSNGSIDLHRLRFGLRDAHGHEFKFLEPRKAVDNLYEYYEIGRYVIATRKEIETNFEQAAFQAKDNLQAGQERHGLIFFAFPKEVDNLSLPSDLALRLERLRWPGSNRDTTVELRLSRGQSSQ